MHAGRGMAWHGVIVAWRCAHSRSPQSMEPMYSPSSEHMLTMRLGALARSSGMSRCVSRKGPLQGHPSKGWEGWGAHAWPHRGTEPYDMWALPVGATHTPRPVRYRPRAAKPGVCRGQGCDARLCLTSS